MKKIKKLKLNKKIISILGKNDMNLVKGGGYNSSDNLTMCQDVCYPKWKIVINRNTTSNLRWYLSVIQVQKAFT